MSPGAKRESMKLSFDDESTPVEDRKKRKKVLVGLCQHSVLCNEII